MSTSTKKTVIIRRYDFLQIPSEVQQPKKKKTEKKARYKLPAKSTLAVTSSSQVFITTVYL
jgi:hypothetical protein